MSIYNNKNNSKFQVCQQLKKIVKDFSIIKQMDPSLQNKIQNDTTKKVEQVSTFSSEQDSAMIDQSLHQNQQDIRQKQQQADQIQQQQQYEQDLQYDQQQEQYNYDDCNYMQYEVQQVKTKIHKELNFNAQYQMKQLIQRINTQVQQIDSISCLGFDWSMILYFVCKWNISLCSQLISNGQGHHKKIIKYVPEFISSQGYTDFKFCQVCYQNKMLVKNLCGHEFCQNCWMDHLIYNIDQNQPFPLCMALQCDTRLSNTVCTILTHQNHKYRQKYIQVLCRNYATNNSSVKMCKGTKGKNCNRCFTVQKLLSIIQCQNCSNFVCPRCGQRSHGPSECDNVKRWIKLGQTTMGLIQYYFYQKCPKCKNGVERTAGCNEINCRCGQTFCYICGQPWSPTHIVQNCPDYCPNYKQFLKKYRQLKQRKKNNVIQFCFRIQDKRSQLLTLDQLFHQQQIYLKNLSNMKKVFLNHFKFHESQLKIIQFYSKFNMKAFCVIYGEQINDYFMKNQRSDFFCNQIRAQIRKINLFLFDYLQKMYILLIKKPQTLTEQDELNLLPQKKQKFYNQFFLKLKQLEVSKNKIKSIGKQQFYCSIFEEDYLLQK